MAGVPFPPSLWGHRVVGRGFCGSPLEAVNEDAAQISFYAASLRLSPRPWLGVAPAALDRLLALLILDTAVGSWWPMGKARRNPLCMVVAQRLFCSVP